MRKNAGMSLLQMLVTLQVSSILVLMIGNYANTTFRMFSHIDKVAAAGDTIDEVKMFIAPKHQCTLNLKDMPLVFNQPAGFAVPRIRAFDKDGNANSNVVVSGQKTHGMTVESIRLVPYTKVDPALIMANLEIRFSKEIESSAGPTELTRKLPIFARVKSGKITECWGKKDHGTAELNQLCLSTSDGALDTFDPVTNSCKLANGEWFDGENDKASCPKGTIIPAKMSWQSNCRGKLPGGFVDTFPKTMLKLTNGGSKATQRDPVRLSLAGNTCRCDWAADIPSTTVAGGKCRILCIVP